ncbi:MAG: extracellular solute-binding protein [Xenococcaceae cyanobacterium]
MLGKNYILTRRSFLLSAGTMALTQVLSGCSGEQAALKVLLLKGSIPPQLLGQFRKQLAQRRGLIFKAEVQLKDLFRLLQTWQKKSSLEETDRDWLPLIKGRTPAIADLVTLGDYWLAEAIQENLIQPLDIEELDGWQKLSSPWQPWQNLVKRNDQGEPDSGGAIWGAPYRWGSTLIAYRRDKFKTLGWTPTDWSDLWREELRDRISLLDQPREVIGLTLKKLGYSYNTPDLTKVPNLKSELLALQQQVKFYSSDNYLQPLILGDTWLAVGWSTDILAVRSRYPIIDAVIPQSGTSLWADLWVQPTQPASESTNSPSLEGKNNLSLINQWIDFCWQPQSASEISLFTAAASPVILSMKKDDLPKDLRENPLLAPPPQILENSDFLSPLPPETLKQYQSLWKEIRR